MIEPLAAVRLLLLHPRQQDVLDLVQLKIRITEQGDQFILLIQLDIGAGSLEIIPVGNLPPGNIHRVLQRDHIDFGTDIK
jgi:hypothetical protein